MVAVSKHKFERKFQFCCVNLCSHIGTAVKDVAGLTEVILMREHIVGVVRIPKNTSGIGQLDSNNPIVAIVEREGGMLLKIVYVNHNMLDVMKYLTWIVL